MFMQLLIVEDAVCRCCGLDEEPLGLLDRGLEAYVGPAWMLTNCDSRGPLNTIPETATHTFSRVYLSVAIRRVTVGQAAAS